MTAGSIIGIYTRHAALFDRLRGRGLSERRWFARFTAAVPARRVVLDLGCGMGEPLSRHILARGRGVHGLDASAPLLALARARLPRGHWRQGDMRRFGLAGRFSGVLAWDSLFHLRACEQRRLLRRIARLARPGAALMFTAGPARGTAWGRFGGEALHHASLSPGEYRAWLGAHGFRVLDFRHRVRDAGGRTICLAIRSCACSTIPAPAIRCRMTR